MRLIDRPFVKWAVTCVCIITGNALFAFIVAAFIIPHGIIMGGVTGISIVISGLYPDIEVSVFIFIINAVLLLLGLIVLGKKFALTTIAGTVLYPLFLGLFQRIPGIIALTDDSLVAAIFAGCLLGIAIGMVMRVGSSTGGMDIVNLVLAHIFHLPVAFFVVICDVLVVGGQALFTTPEKTLLGIIVIVLETLLLDKTMILGKSRMQVYVVSEKFEEIRQKLLYDLNAGVTMTFIETGRLSEDTKAIMCVIPQRKLYAATEIIRKTDPHAFVTVTKINEVRGRGFTEARNQI